MKVNSNAILRCAEWVMPGHPDKLADAIADTLVQEAVRLDPKALCAIEVAVHRDAVYLTGRLACGGSEAIDLQGLVRDVYASAGYGARWLPAPEEVRVEGNLCIDRLAPGEEPIRAMSDDQSVVTGYAVDLPGIGFVPPEQWLARELARRLFALVEDPEIGLCPDGKVMVVLEEEGAVGSVAEPVMQPLMQPAMQGAVQRALQLRAVSLSLLADCGEVELQRAARACVVSVLEELDKRLPGCLRGDEWELVFNGSGTFEIAGPEGDNGLSGKKLLLDHYGPRVPIGGTALSGKDFHKPDRAGTLLARRMARLIVGSGVADEVTVQLMTFPGDLRPRFARAWTPQGELPNAHRWLEVMDGDFGSASGWWQGLDLVQMARWGWFGGAGRWEQLGLG